MKDFRKTQDERIVESVQADSALMCAAHGCPRRWTVDGPQGRLCSAHAWAEPHRWPEITDDLQRQWPQAQPAPSKPSRTYTADERRAAIRNLAAVWTRRPNKAWAEKLRDAERAGRRLTAAQRDMWRQALGVRDE